MLRAGMMDQRLAAYEGLIHCTAERYVGFMDYDLDDLKQIFRVKIWQVLEIYDASRGMDEEKWVFQCMRNRVKDLLKEQDRRNERRNGTQLYVEDTPGHVTAESFEMRYFSSSGDYDEVEDEDPDLPSTLTELERAVVDLLVADFNQTEIAVWLDIPRQRVRSAHASIRSKMADWRPAVTQPGELLAFPATLEALATAA